LQLKSVPTRFSSTTAPPGASRRRPGLNVIGTLGLVLQATRAGIIGSVKPELDKLLETSFFLGEQLYDQLLRMAGESDA
jgi:predicted nucleic acid-binding protein